MANFAYRGRNGAGEIVQGSMEGANAGAVADQLVGSGVTPPSSRTPEFAL